MKFIVTRTSLWENEKPCDEAFLHSHDQWQVRTCSEEEFNERFAEREGLWRSKGTDHAVTKEGYITRRMEDAKFWTVEINSIEQLREFAKKYGSLVFSGESWDSKSPEIEIYDDYRE